MEFLKKKFSLEEAKQLSPLVLAFIGDAVYELFVRNYLVHLNNNMPVNMLHNKAVSFVKAHCQSEMMNNLLVYLNTEEIAIFKRGRNAKSATVPKHAKVVDYRIATGFEALLGYLYITDQIDRLNELFEKIIEFKNCN
ncbi:mini-ribonuclease 3 [Clostridium acetireducens DSM 10703]|jgi:ribonuclease-3 family protein|uniref:Mini-ribonuclease 3 n=1 Tax=Clostridium acetireducens DSM 10703 TaxID=1121290 RepID=A0A1E8F0G0_9CLOT|nr:ribonuclease III domain-containing protein [Clostridium acetireducens]OFI06914.1 mini-ribonuclease 3 [Clostridium acetireducens DSM 10703]